MSITGLYTIGYEGAALDDFLATLKLIPVDTLLDVRELPMSRRRGFSKAALRDALSGVGITYQHERALGSPREVRHRLKSGESDYRTFFSEYDRHLDEQSDLLDHLAGSLKGRIALLCYERDHCQCHRASVARALRERTGLRPVHLGVQSHEQRKRYAASHMGACQSAPAT